MNKKEIPLVSHQLTSSEKEKILIRLDPLVQYLGSPGDWGYGTKLGQLAIQLIEVRNELIKAETSD